MWPECSVSRRRPDGKPNYCQKSDVPGKNVQEGHVRQAQAEPEQHRCRYKKSRCKYKKSIGKLQSCASAVGGQRTRAEAAGNAAEGGGGS